MHQQHHRGPRGAELQKVLQGGLFLESDDVRFGGLALGVEDTRFLVCVPSHKNAEELGS